MFNLFILFGITIQAAATYSKNVTVVTLCLDKEPREPPKVSFSLRNFSDFGN